MIIALVSNFLYPEALGGTGIYCYQLANALIERGNQVYWFVPGFDNTTTSFEVRGEGIQVVKFAALDKDKKSNLSFTIGSFIEEMKARNIKIAHFHEFGGYEGVSMELLVETKKAGISTIVTLHLANYICQTGTLHYGGSEPCDGKIIQSRCSSCYLFSNKTFSESLNLTLTQLFNKVLKLSSVQSIPRIKRFMTGINMKHKFISSVGENADVIVTLTKWFKEVLIINGVPQQKIKYIQQIAPEIDNGMFQYPKEERNNYVFIGRVNKEKGVDLLLQLASRLKKENPAVVIDIYGPYLPTKILPHTIIHNLNKYDNVRYKGVLPREEVMKIMSGYKAVILPSRAAEMAPLIIMEANKLRIPVIASDVPGSAELIQQNDCGIIFKYNSIDELYNSIKKIETNIHTFTYIQAVENNFYYTAQKHEEIYTACLN